MNVIFEIPILHTTTTLLVIHHTDHIRHNENVWRLVLTIMTEESQIMILTCMTAPPQPSKQELAAAEAQTMTDIKWTAASAVVLYFCKSNQRLGSIQKED